MWAWPCVHFGCVYVLVSRGNQPIFLSQSCHHWNPFEVLPKQQVPPCALISSTHAHTYKHTHTPFSSPSKDRACFPTVTPTCCPFATITRSSLLLWFRSWSYFRPHSNDAALNSLTTNYWRKWKRPALFTKAYLLVSFLFSYPTSAACSRPQ